MRDISGIGNHHLQSQPNWKPRTSNFLHIWLKTLFGYLLVINTNFKQAKIVPKGAFKGTRGQFRQTEARSSVSYGAKGLNVFL